MSVLTKRRNDGGRELGIETSCRRSVMCGAVLSVMGIALLVVRLSAMGTYGTEQFQYTSNFFVIVTALALISQLRVPILNCIVMTAFPVSILVTIGDVYYIVTEQPGVLQFAWLLTLHIPVAVVGIVVFIRRRDLANFAFTSIAAVVVISWILFVDPRIDIGILSLDTTSSDAWIIIAWAGWYIVPLAFILHDLYQRRLIYGSVVAPLCKCGA